MELIERTMQMELLLTMFTTVRSGEGHCLFLSGEAGIGKTSLVNAFSKELGNNAFILRGTCDALFTPRPLAPLYDIAPQLQNNFSITEENIADRAGIFAKIFRELSLQTKPCLLIFEDIHWADEATLDFIKFLGRRITQLRCLFLLTFRDDEISSQPALRAIMGQLPPDAVTRLLLPPLSKEAVTQLSNDRGYNGEDVYSVAGGNPFYVNEILASYSSGIPESIKDAVLSVYNRQEENSKKVLELLSVIPRGFQLKYLEKFTPSHASAIDHCLNASILTISEGFIGFKHELYRRTIETSLSPIRRVLLNQTILEILQQSFEQYGEIERIIHHAKNANAYATILQYAPIAAKKAASAGAHIEATKLYLSVIEYNQSTDKASLLPFYEAYAYECYLTNQIKEAIIFSSKSLELWKEKKEAGKTGNCLRFLSRLWWNDDNPKKAEEYARQAIEVLEAHSDEKARAMAYGNMAQLKLFSDLSAECISWGEKAIKLAESIQDQETLAYALNIVGSIKLRIPSSAKEGLDHLQRSLAIAIQHSYHEHIARAYTNLAYAGIITKDYPLTATALEAGLLYYEQNKLDLWYAYMLIVKARLKLDKGEWNEAVEISERILRYENPVQLIKIFTLTTIAAVKMRTGDNEDIISLLNEAADTAATAMEPQRILRALCALLEYEWINDCEIIPQQSIDNAIKLIKGAGNIYDNSEFSFWLLKARNQKAGLTAQFEGYLTHTVVEAQRAAVIWEKAANPYQQALCLFDGNDDDKRKSLVIVQALGAEAVHAKMKMHMRTAGIKGIPRGVRKTTRSNPAGLTDRELAILNLLKEGLQNKEIAGQLFIAAKTVDNHITSILFKLDVNSRAKAVKEAVRLEILK